MKQRAQNRAIKLRRHIMAQSDETLISMLAKETATFDRTFAAATEDAIYTIKAEIKRREEDAIEGGFDWSKVEPIEEETASSPIKIEPYDA